MIGLKWSVFFVRGLRERKRERERERVRDRERVRETVINIAHRGKDK